MTLDIDAPRRDGTSEGEAYWGTDGSVWLWQTRKDAPKRFEVIAEHIPLSETDGFGIPRKGAVATGLTAEEMAPFLRALLLDPRCTMLTVNALPPPGQWVKQEPIGESQEPCQP